MNKYLFILICLLSLNTNAQITLTAATSNPLPGDTAHYYGYNGNAGPAGANVTWDFSFLTNSNKDTIYYYDSLTGCNSSHQLYARNATPAPQMECIYYAYDNDSLLYEGHSGSWTSSNYGNYLMLRYPTTYDGIIYIDSFTSFDYGGTSFINSKGYQSITADGYGTLILPDTTYTNVLRVKKVVTVKKVQNISGQPFPPMQYIDEVYEWYSDVASRTYLLQIRSHIATINVDDTEVLTEGLDVYPNPATNELSIKTNGVQIKSLLLKDITGKTIIEKAVNTSAYLMEINSVIKGLYYMDIYTDKGIARKKVQIQ